MLPILNTFDCTSPTSQYFQQDWVDMLNNQYIEPAKKLGFDFIGTLSTNDPISETGAHILHFKNKQKHNVSLENLKQFDTWDEGSRTTYNYYYGILIITISWGA